MEGLRVHATVMHEHEEIQDRSCSTFKTVIQSSRAYILDTALGIPAFLLKRPFPKDLRFKTDGAFENDPELWFKEICLDTARRA